MEQISGETVLSEDSQKKQSLLRFFSNSLVFLDGYEEGRRKAKEAETMSDLQSEAEVSRQRPPRCIRFKVPCARCSKAAPEQNRAPPCYTVVESSWILFHGTHYCSKGDGWCDQ
ncbi:uncharacterized protein [Paramormyrops kingsleyae]|uniref:uncharacterized protein isoform X2 n=1 Tax=Paramormyrops kingsleyae TaxID=1676925 RepID=UPI003B970360